MFRVHCILFQSVGGWALGREAILEMASHTINSGDALKCEAVHGHGSISARAGEAGFSKSSNPYAHYATEVISSLTPGVGEARASAAGQHQVSRVLLSSHYEAFDPDWLLAQGVCRLLTVAEECEPPESIRALFPDGKLRWIPVRESPYTQLPIQEAVRSLDQGRHQ